MGAIPAGAYAALLSGLVVLGVSAILVRAANAPGPVSGFYRMAIGWLVLTGIVAARRSRLRFSREGLLWSALAGVLIGIDMAFWTTGIMLSGPTTPTLLGNTTPVWVGLAVMALYKEKHPPKFWVGVLIALSGAAVVVGGDALLDGGFNLGALLGLVSALFYSSFFLAIQRARRHTDALTALWVYTFSCGLVLLLVALAFGQPLTGYSGQTLLIFLAMGIVIQVAAWLLITYAQGHIPAAVVSPTMLGQPVLTAIFAVPLLGERLNWVDLIGGAAVLGGVLLVHFSKEKKTAKLEAVR